MVEKTIVAESDNSDIRSDYYKLIGFMKGVTRNSDISLLLKLDQLADQSGHFDLTARTRDLICEELCLNKPNLSAAIKRLIDLEVIMGNKGSYDINESVFICKSTSNKSQININIQLIK